MREEVYGIFMIRFQRTSPRLRKWSKTIQCEPMYVRLDPMHKRLDGSVRAQVQKCGCIFIVCIFGLLTSLLRFFTLVSQNMIAHIRYVSTVKRRAMQESIRPPCRACQRSSGTNLNAFVYSTHTQVPFSHSGFLLTFLPSFYLLLLPTGDTRRSGAGKRASLFARTLGNPMVLCSQWGLSHVFE